jgi:hypothetical protein
MTRAIVVIMPLNRRNVDIEALARRLDVLRPWETILDDS